MYAYTTKSGVRVVSTVPLDYLKGNLFTALYAEYARWIRRARGRD